MTACPHHLATDDGLPCTKDAGHAPGCVFESTSGVPDRHDQPGRGDGE